MRIDTLSRQDALALMGSEATEAEADAMLEMLRACGRADTDEIPDGEWRVIMDHAIERAGGRDILTVETHYDGVDYQAEIDGDRVTISRRGRQSPTWEWCGEGTIRDGVIADCPADLPGEVYEALDEMIAGRRMGLQVFALMETPTQSPLAPAAGSALRLPCPFCGRAPRLTSTDTNKSWNLPAHLTVEKADRGINVTIAKRWDCNVSVRIYRRCDAAKKLAAGFAMAATTMTDLMRNRLEWDEAIAKRWSQPQPVRGNMSLVPAEIVAIVNQARQCCRQESFPDRCQHLDEELRAMAHTLHVHYADRDRREIAEDLERAKGGTPINRPHPSDCL